MLKERYTEKEIMDDFALANDELRQNLDEIVFLNRYLGSKNTLLNALDKIYAKYQKNFEGREVVIADLACGCGDLLQVISEWANRKHLAVSLLGVDANAFMIGYALDKFKVVNCSYEVANILMNFQMNTDIVCLNSVCHHFQNDELIELLRQLKLHTKYAIIINDLRRNWFAYFSIKWLSKLFKFSRMSKNDGPLSVRKAFRQQELQKILSYAGIDSYSIARTWMFRWQIIIWCRK